MYIRMLFQNYFVWKALQKSLCFYSYIVNDYWRLAKPGYKCHKRMFYSCVQTVGSGKQRHCFLKALVNCYQPLIKV